MKLTIFNKETGFAGVEFAIILPVLLIIAFGIIDFGRLLFQYQTLTKTSRDGARYLAAVTRPPAYAGDAAYSNFVAQATNLTVCGSPVCGQALLPGLTASNVTVDYPSSGIAAVNQVRLTVSGYSTSFLTGVFSSTTKDLGTVSVTMRQVQQ